MDRVGIRGLARLLALLAITTGAYAQESGASADQKPAGDTTAEETPVDNIGHRRHLHRHNQPHPAGPDARRFHTNRSGPVLSLPGEQDAFFFVVFGDRTGGPVEGVSVLADAVRDTNLLEPDLVMTVGDLVEGYNQTPAWMQQMTEFKGIMDRLLCPWFPVAGNHDIYWRGPEDSEPPPGEHERDYEAHFGPLWYAFEHKNCWFIALYSDEGNPETGEKNFNKPESQKMSDEQFAWLKETLAKAKDAEHVFLFLHHPRWLRGGYGDDWDRVHELLASAGNVSAVFAGHIHRMRYDGPRDGIEYFALATVGGGQSFRVPDAGYLHQFHVVTVRPQQIAVAALPVGEVMDPRDITGAVQAECNELARTTPAFGSRTVVRGDGSAEGTVSVTVSNPTSRPIEVTLAPFSGDSRWLYGPDHAHRVLEPGASGAFAFKVWRLPDSVDEAFRPLELTANIEYLTEGFRYAIPEIRTPFPLDIRLHAPEKPGEERAADFDGEDDYLRVPSERIPLPDDSPLTLECWFQADDLGGRTGLVTKTENSDYGIFVSNGAPDFYVLIGDSYVEAKTEAPILETGRWHHVAGVYDGKEARLYVDGQRVATVERAGKRRTNGLPLLVGADVTGRGDAMSHFDGRIDGVRLSAVARYSGETFTPERRPGSDSRTLLLLNMDGSLGTWLYDESPAGVHPTVSGGVKVVPAVE